MPDRPRFDASVKALLQVDGRALLLSYINPCRSSDTGIHYNLPGGKIDDGESLADAVRRKVFAESGIVVEAERLLFVHEYLPSWDDGLFGSVQKYQFTFLTSIKEYAEPRMEDPPDPLQVGFEWVPIAELPSKELTPRGAGSQIVSALNGVLEDVLLQDRPLP